MLIKSVFKFDTRFHKIGNWFVYTSSVQKLNKSYAVTPEDRKIPSSSSNDSGNNSHWLSNAVDGDPWTIWWQEENHIKHPGNYFLPAVSIPTKIDKGASIFLKNFDKEVISTVGKRLDDILSSRKVYKKSQTLVEPFKHRRETNHFFEETLNLVNLSPFEFNQVQKNAKKFKNQSVYNWKQVIYDNLNAAGYLLNRSPACYASSLRVLNEIKIREPDFIPTSILDFGSGTGMCVWAANTLWKQSLKQYLCIDSSKEMNDLAFFIFSGGSYEEALPGIFIRRFLPVSFQGEYDIVISAYSLSELPSEHERLQLLNLLWEKTKRYLVIIENGNFYGYYIIMEARNMLVHGLQGPDIKNALKCSKFTKPAKLFAPCPHNLACPKWTIDSCVFSQKYLLPSYFLKTCKPENPCGLEKFSYIIFEKQSSNNQDQSKWPRAVAEPNRQKNVINCHFCTPDGNIAHVCIGKKKHGKHLFKVSKFTKLGDSLPIFPAKSD